MLELRRQDQDRPRAFQQLAQALLRKRRERQQLRLLVDVAARRQQQSRTRMLGGRGEQLQPAAAPFPVEISPALHALAEQVDRATA